MLVLLPGVFVEPPFPTLAGLNKEWYTDYNDIKFS